MNYIILSRFCLPLGKADDTPSPYGYKKHYRNNFLISYLNPDKSIFLFYLLGHLLPKECDVC